MSDTTAAAEDSFKLYRYEPSIVAAIISVVVFGLLTAGHLWRIYRTRAFYFTAFAIGGIFQTVGYVGRALGHADKEALGPYIMQAILILVAPALFAASIYMILARLIRAVRAEHHSLIPTLWVTRVFVAGDVLSFTLQAGGGGLQGARDADLFDLGEKVLLAGLWVQIVVFGFFVVVTGLFHRRLLLAPTLASERGVVAWRRHLSVLYATSALVLVRSVFRVVEYIQGNAGYLMSHEVFLYVFDMLLMVAVMAVFLVWYVDDLQEAGAKGAGDGKDMVAVGSNPGSSDGMMEDLSYRRHNPHDQV